MGILVVNRLINRKTNQWLNTNWHFLLTDIYNQVVAALISILKISINDF
jgi:hypothetical protein